MQQLLDDMQIIVGVNNVESLLCLSVLIILGLFIVYLFKKL